MNITRLVELFFEEERLCRICLDSEDDPTSETTRLISPCNCKGSAQYVHLGCLQTWQRLSVRKESSTNCDVCRQVYSYNKKIPTSQQYTRRLYAGGSIVASGVSYGVAWTGHIINKSGTWEWKRWFMNDPQWHTFTLLGLDWMDIVWGGTIIISTVGSVVLAISIARNPAAFRKMAKASFKNGVEIARNTPEYVRKTSKYVRKTPGYLRRASQHIREMLDIVYSMTGKARGYTKFMRTYHWILLLTVAYFIARGGHSLNAKEILQWKRLFMADPQRRVFTILGLDWMDLFWGGSLVGPCIGITRLALTRSKEALFKTRVGSILKNLVEAMSFLAKAAQRQPWFEPVVRSAILLHVGGFIAWSGHALDKRILSWKPLFMDNSRPRVLAIFGLDSMDVLTGGSLALPTVKLMSYMADVAMELFCKSQDEEAFRHLLDATVGFMCE
ncbi:hypothetical protein BGX31_000133 [Mortierella sp. GBA43]|nr:hypothetical protein BGX31_000133 [Mortierella sp. GBA43]